MDRKGELEKKRQRLEELRKAKDLRAKSGTFATQLIEQCEVTTKLESVRSPAVHAADSEMKPEYSKENRDQSISCRK
jgi:hypothetical protein